MISIWRRASTLDRHADEADRIDVLDLAAGAEALAGLAHRHVDVGAQRALLHVAVAGTEVAQDRAQLGEERHRLLRRAQVRLRHDLHQRDARAVEIDVAQAGVLVVQQLAGVLLEVQPLDADVDASAVRQIDGDDAFADDRRLVLADLIALRQVGIEIVLPVEHRAVVDLRLEPEPGADRLLDAFLVDHRQHAGHRGVDQRDMLVRLAAEFGRGAGEQLGVGGDLGMDLHADHDLPVAGCAFDVAWTGSHACSCRVFKTGPRDCHARGETSRRALAPHKPRVRARSPASHSRERAVPNEPTEPRQQQR